MTTLPKSGSRFDDAILSGSTTVHPDTARAAATVVRGRATDDKDAARLLDALGLGS